MRLLITGSNGMVGRALSETLATTKNFSLLLPKRQELDLLNFAEVDAYIKKNKPDFVIHCAALVGGIAANIKNPIEFLLYNSEINFNVIKASFQNNIRYLLNMGSSCMYPKDREELHEDDIMTGKLEPTNEAYALAKISASLLCDYVCKQLGYDYKTIIPGNLYGPHDNFNLNSSHLIPAIITKTHHAIQNRITEIEIWGDGKARREFMYVADLVEFIVLAIEKISELPARINVGIGRDYSINEYYHAVADVMGYTGSFKHNLEKPVGMAKKLMNIKSATELGWAAKTSLKSGITQTVNYFLNLDKTEDLTI